MHGVPAACQGQRVTVFQGSFSVLTTFFMYSSSRRGRNARDMLNLKQKVTLTGLGSKVFEQNVATMESIATKFIRAIDSDAILPMEDVLFEGHATIHAENR